VLVLLQELLHHEQNPQEHACTSTMHHRVIDDVAALTHREKAQIDSACLTKRMRTETGSVAVLVEQGEHFCAHWGIVAAGTAITHAPVHRQG
jgi:hypothetical protein